MPQINFANVGRLIEDLPPLGLAIQNVIEVGNIHGQAPINTKVNHHARQIGAGQLLHIPSSKWGQLEIGIHRRIEDQFVWIGLVQIQVIATCICKPLF